ncbi:M61 family metallopeptidase [Pedobacter sp. UBA5917]|jgi:predicted metalloprotease with PDZ domain|uniref:M61 family metallopeptidase n=1 Tax=Pedobacter sp. UBA5917 TaxID=1947061 RepID=UPI0025F24EDA|nr:PDZ domain-containing protein [Pedobacter sp. UBA5917]
MIAFLVFVLGPLLLSAQTTKTVFVISMPKPSNHLYHVELNYRSAKKGALDFHMPVWTPGFYSLMDYAGAVSNFEVKGADNRLLKWKKTDRTTWRVNTATQNIKISYDVKAEDPFIANNNLTEDYGYIIPGALLLYTKQALPLPVTVKVKPYQKWPLSVATGLSELPGQANVFTAANFDELYDSPLLMGRLESLPVMMVKGIPHQFIGYNMGDLDRKQLTADLEKIIASGSNIIGEIPYKHYTFLAVGTPQGGSFGGIEHLNSASLIIGNKNLLAEKNRIHFYNFLAHEYFHAYNVKRIRPIELGPFDYAKENYTNLLWISEGFTVYYENIITRAAKLMTEQQVLDNFRQCITNYENKEGHLHQSASAASRAIWEMEGNPNNRDADALNKTISVYDKGCALALMLDLKIRHETRNQRSLDDLMKSLYRAYYKEKNRGFTESEFKKEAEQVAGTPLDELFLYANTTAAPDYSKYFAYAGLNIDTISRRAYGNNLGIVAGMNSNKIIAREVIWQSPAWKAGVQPGDQILSIDGNQVTSPGFPPLKDKKNGDQITMNIMRNGAEKKLMLTLNSWQTRSFEITPLPNPDKLQTLIYNSWMRN